MISGSVVVPFQKGPYFCRATRDERLGFLLPLEEVVEDALVLFIFIILVPETRAGAGLVLKPTGY